MVLLASSTSLGIHITMGRSWSAYAYVTAGSNKTCCGRGDFPHHIYDRSTLESAIKILDLIELSDHGSRMTRTVENRKIRSVQMRITWNICRWE